MQDASLASSKTQTVKLVTLGDMGAGKTTLCQAVCGNADEIATAPTLGIDFWSKLLHCDNNRIRVNAYDTSGQERFQALTPSYLRTADVILIVLDATMSDENMANSLQLWHGVARRSSPPTAKFIVAITKRDLIDGTVIAGTAISTELVRCGLKRYHVVTGKNGFDGAGVHALWSDISECAIICCRERQPSLRRAAMGIDTQRLAAAASSTRVRTCFDKVTKWCQ